MSDMIPRFREDGTNTSGAILLIVITAVFTVLIAFSPLNVGSDTGKAPATVPVAASQTARTAPVWHPAAEEDQPGWDCRTQGDQMCGVGVSGGPIIDSTGPGGPYVSCPRFGALTDGPSSDGSAGETVCNYSDDLNGV